MAAPDLTPRQEEILGLLKQGLGAVQIAKKLKISDNAVYQNIRKMRERGASVTTPTGRTGAKNKRGGKSGKKPTRALVAGTGGAASSPPSSGGGGVQITAHVSVTPLQSVRNRQAEIRNEVKEASQAVASAMSALNAAKAAEKRISERHKAEMTNLMTAERALAPKKTAPKAKAATKAKSARKRPTTRRAAQKPSSAANGGAPDKAGKAPALSVVDA